MLYALNEDIKNLSDNGHTSSDHLFREYTWKNLNLIKEHYKFDENLDNSKSTPSYKPLRSSYGDGYQCQYNAEASFSYSSSTGTSLNYQSRIKILSSSKTEE